MSRQFFDDAVDPGVVVDRAAEAAVVATAYAAVQPPQVEAERFMRENGADASTHGPVGRAGRAGDPDVESDASDRP